MKLSLPAALLLTAGLWAGAAAAETDISITDAWSRATPPSASTAVVYMTITDRGAPDTLTAVSTPAAASAKLHESKNVDGVMQMRPVDAVTVSPMAPLQLLPGGYHVMLEGLKQPLRAGDEFPVTLTFEHAGAVTATAQVRSLGVDPPVNHFMDGTGAGHMGSGH